MKTSSRTERRFKATHRRDPKRGLPRDHAKYGANQHWKIKTKNAIAHARRGKYSDFHHHADHHFDAGIVVEPVDNAWNTWNAWNAWNAHIDFITNENAWNAHIAYLSTH
jgi:hypothetical protein